MNQTIRSFHVDVPEAELTELRRRIKATKAVLGVFKPGCKQIRTADNAASFLFARGRLEAWIVSMGRPHS